jgi:glutathione S-transferase
MGTIEGFQPSFEKDGAADGTGAKTVLTLYGTTTSPYSRKARILARASALDLTFVDTRTEAGAAALARVAPLGKVPVVEVTGRKPLVLPDSGLIAAWLWSERAASLRAAGFASAEGDAAWPERALVVVVEGALDAAINRFYLLKDKLPDQGYVTRQRDRVATTLDWLEARMPAFARPVSPAALSLGCALDWMVLRAVVELPRFPKLAAFRDAWAASGVGDGTEPG